MLVRGFPAAAVRHQLLRGGGRARAPTASSSTPGIGVEEQLDALLREHDLNPVAVLLTHGHLDHTFSVTPVCGARGIPAYVHPDDDALLTDPMKGLSARQQRRLRRPAGSGRRPDRRRAARPRGAAGARRPAAASTSRPATRPAR